MLDIQLRSVKDHLFDPLSRAVPQSISPLHITLLAFISGLACCYLASTDQPTPSLSLWLINRALDCLDGAVARQRGQTSDLGGFLDLLGDFIIYSLIPICCGLSTAAGKGESWNLWLSVAVLEASFHINNFVLFFVAAILEKRKASAVKNDRDEAEGDFKVKELTSVAMRPALVEGMESGILFTIMLAAPARTELVCWFMAFLVGIGICQRVVWLVPAMK